MFFVLADRERLIDFLPKNGVIAEIGVAEGDFSQLLLKKLQPQCLHLIDPWVHQDVDEYLSDPNNADNKEQQRRYEYVLNRFRNEIGTGQVVVHRKFSQDVVSDFDEKYFDLIYIDAMHTYDAVLRDLDGFKDKLKNDGLIGGHDYTGLYEDFSMDFAVTQAVSTFLARTGYNFVALSSEACATYVLSPPGDCHYRWHFLKSILESDEVAIELPDQVAPCYFPGTYHRHDGSSRSIPRFVTPESSVLKPKI